MSKEDPGNDKQGLPNVHELAEHVKEMIEQLGKEKGANIAASVNVGDAGKTSVSSKQRIVQRDGKTETITERIEERHS